MISLRKVVKMRARGFLTAFVVLALTACQGNTAELTESTAQIARLEDQLVVLAAERDRATKDLEDSQASLLATETELVALTRSADLADDAAKLAEDRAVAAETAVEALLEQYDPQIRAARQVAYDAEVVRACEVAKTQVDASIASLTNWTDDWQSIGTESDLMASVEACAVEERSKTMEQRELDRLASCGVVDVDSLEKDPDAYTGTCVHFWANISQYDANTGVCSFRAGLSAVRSTYWLDYSGNAMFLTDSDTDCPELDGIDVDDFIEVWAIGSGSLTYDTTIGGSATATLWTIDVVELVKKG